MGFKTSHQVVLFVLIPLFTHAQLDYRPGPPYSDHPNTLKVNSDQNYKFKSNSVFEKLPLVTPNIFRTLSKAFGPGFPVHAPPTYRQMHNKNRYSSSRPPPPPPQFQQNNNQRHQPQHYQESSGHPAQTAHVYFPQTQTDSVQRPMPNVIVRYQSSPSSPNNYIQPIQQYSEQQPEVVVPEVVVPQYLSNDPVQQSAQQYSDAIPALQQQPVVQPPPMQQNAPQQIQQESQTSSPSRFSISLEYPPRKKSRGHKKPPRPHYLHHLKSYYSHKIKKSAHKVETYPVFTTIGKGLDGLNAVRKGVKKGTGKVVASGVKLGAKVIAKVIKVASSI